MHPIKLGMSLPAYKTNAGPPNPAHNMPNKIKFRVT